ncbi:MAG: hypothetical protein HYV07_01640 [Deltaproteobacteria bacterium]|nr:hypothetical protein [Deltaproteobacteria bacterium]
MDRSSRELDREDAQPYFIWDVTLTVGELRRLLKHPDRKTRALWMARVLREARYRDVWRFVSLADVVASYAEVRPRLGRARPMWDFLIEGWRNDGLLPD